MYKKLSPIIEDMRITQNYPEMFNDFEKMSIDVVKVREKMYPKLSGEDLVSIKNFLVMKWRTEYGFGYCYKREV